MDTSLINQSFQQTVSKLKERLEKYADEKDMLDGIELGVTLRGHSAHVWQNRVYVNIEQPRKGQVVLELESVNNTPGQNSVSYDFVGWAPAMTPGEVALLDEVRGKNNQWSAE